MPMASTPWSPSGINSWLSRRTFVFGLRVWVLAGIAAGAAFVLLLVLFSLCIACCHRRRRRRRSANEFLKRPTKVQLHDRSPAAPVLKDIPVVTAPPRAASVADDVRIDVGKAEHRVVSNESSRTWSGDKTPVTPPPAPGARMVGTPPEVSHLGWGRWFTLRELEEATGELAEENVIGEGGYGIVYRGVLGDGTAVAIKNLLNNRGQAEREFRVEVETIGRVRHKNLVRLLGYCVEGAYRMLVYEYVDNGNLEQWLHGDVGEVSPLTWDVRMNIILGTAKGLAYLHEGLEPKVVHRDIKASNILLDRQWNPKVSDFGLAKLICSDRSYITTRVMGTFGYVAPEYANSGMLNERSDVYSFGVLVMEIITGRSPVNYTRPQGEQVNLVEWLKNMVAEKCFDQLIDPKLPENPSSKALKRVLLIALKCVDPDSHKRPKIGHVVHMLEMDEHLFPEEHKGTQQVQPPQTAERYIRRADPDLGDDDRRSRWR